jgi:di/tricarboxylate transporter
MPVVEQLAIGPHAWAVLSLTVLALFLFTRKQIPLETSSLAVLVLLTVGFALFPYQSHGASFQVVDLFSGFGHEALIAVCALMIVGHGLIRTGALEPVGRALSRSWVSHPILSLLAMLFSAALLSAFVNNTPIVILLIPVLLNVAIRTGTKTSSILMPMGFATLLGGMTTTIGTSTNLLVVSVAAELGVERFSMFDFVVPALGASALGILYLAFIAPRLIPDREPLMLDSAPRVFSAQLNILSGSFADGKTVSELRSRTNGRMQILRIRKSTNAYSVALPDAVVNAGDRLMVTETANDLKEFENLLGADLYVSGKPVAEDNPLAAGDQQTAEIVVVDGSPLINQTLSALRFADVYDLVVLAIHRTGRVIDSMPRGISNVVLKSGDILLVQGAREKIAALKRNGSLFILDATVDLPFDRHARSAVLIMIMVVILSAFGLLPIAVSAVAGVLAMLGARCLTWRDVPQALSTPVILIVVVSLALGHALELTGGAEIIARSFMQVAAGASPAVILSALMLLMACLTNVLSNNAAAVIGTPIAISLADHLQLPAQPFVLAMMFGANMSFATPMAYKTNLLVMNAGGYTFADFARVGVPLTLLMWLTLSLILPWLYF